MKKELSSRERQTIIEIAKGKTITEISKQMGVSVKTVSTYRRRAIDKIGHGVKNNVELTRYAVREGMVTI